MSSLAGALDQPASYSHGYSDELLPANPGGFSDRDVDMKPPSADVLPKEEEDAAFTSGVLDGGVHEEEMEDLFGNDEKHDVTDAKSDSAPVITPAESGFESDDLSQTEKEHRQALEYLEPEEPGIVLEQVREADVRIPNIPVPKSSDGDHWVIRMPTFVKMDSKPFHPDTYIGPEHEEDDGLHNENIREKSMSIKLKVENTVRWRWTKDESGQDRRQSNSRVIRWSDGSLSLRLGKELFDITKTVDTSGGIVRQSLGGTQSSQSQSQPAASQNPLSSSRSQGLTYLVAQHKRSEVLQAEAVVTGYMTLRPTGMQSETHRMLVRAVGQKHNKVARLRMAPDPTMDPEREKMELMKQSARKSKKKTDDSGFGVRKKRYGQSRKKQGHEIWSEDEEPEYEGSEDDDDLSASKRKADEQKKRGPGEYQEDDFVVADESDDDAEFDGEARSRKKRKHREEEEEDPLDQLDAKIIQRQQDDRKRKHRDTENDEGTTEIAEDGLEAGEDGGDQDMDIESEEEEEEHRVRKAGSGARKKRTMALDDDDE